MAQHNTSSALYSSAWAELDGADQPPVIQRAIAQLTLIAADGRISLKRWNDQYVAACLVIRVDIPSRGPVRGIDIRPIEPIIIVFHAKRYPFQAPWARSDRTDFPTNLLPHLNPVSAGQPPYLCLHRGDIHEWFSRHDLPEFMRRVRAWYRDAARGRLIRRDDGFEPTRLDTFDGFAVFDSSTFNTLIDGNTRSASHELLLFRQGHEAGDRLRYFCAIPIDSVQDAQELMDHSRSLAERTPGHERFIAGVLAWPDADTVSSEYFASLPDDFPALVDLANAHGIALMPAATDLFKTMKIASPIIPFTLAIRRPAIVIGEETPVEFLTFLAISDEPIDGLARLRSAKVSPLAHRTPFTPALARRMTGTAPSPDALLFVGLGALGSKLATHLIRSGHTNLQLIDPDSLAPHNLARHSLDARSVGQNKAKAVTEFATKLFEGSTLEMQHSARTLFDGIDANFNAPIAIDCSASAGVLKWWLHEPSPRVIRCELTTAGSLGFLFAEGPDRNPRLDDLYANLFDLAVEDDEVSGWLVGHRSATLRDPHLHEIDIGLGCAALTTQLPDDIVSIYAAAFSRIVRELPPTAITGVGRLGQQGRFDIVTKTIEPFRTFQAANDPSWTVRYSEPAMLTLTTLTAASGKVETGGLLFGRTDHERRTTHVTRVSGPSADSSGTEFAFHRGIADVPESVRRIEIRTGGQIHYLGEWHSHPASGTTLSGQDRATVKAIRCTLDRAGVSTHIVIVGSKKLAHYMFGPGSSSYDRETTKRRRARTTGSS